MIKFSSNSDFDFGIESVSILTDPSKQLTKRASSKELLKFEKTAGQTDLHIIAVGAYEGTGGNRNCDRFLEKDCIKNAHYFADADRAVHRHHKNKPKDPKFGNIKAAAYNPEMKRIELIVGLDNEKCADILDEQEKKGHTNWSMAAKVSHDCCSFCGHKAVSDADRCSHIPNKLGEINKYGEICEMINPDPNWFEISHVARPADRIGMSLKLASAYKPMLPKDYLNVYGDIYVPKSLQTISKYASEKRDILGKLAKMEKHVDAVAAGKADTSKDLFIKDHATKATSDTLSDSTIDELRKHDPAKLLKELASKGIMFSPGDFAKYLFGDRVEGKHIEGMKTHLPDIFSDLEENDDDSSEAVNDEHFEGSHAGIPKEIQEIIKSLVSGHSLFGEPSHRRVMRITIIKGTPSSLKKSLPEEAKSKEAMDKELAKTYAKYKLAALRQISEQGDLDDQVIWNALVQNRQ